MDIDKKLEEYNEAYSKIMFNLDSIKDFVPENQLRKRKYVIFSDTLKGLADLTSKDNNSKKHNFIGKLFDSNKNDIRDYIYRNEEKLEQCKVCCKCKCFSCIEDCKFEGCNLCELGGYTASCNNKDTAVNVFKHKVLNLRNDKTGEYSDYNVLAIVQDIEYDTLYIIIEQVYNKDRFILYYYPGVSEDTYGEITDVEDFNFASEAYKEIENTL